jgi:GH15 family glucan-1,4-alpha-glucosidase
VSYRTALLSPPVLDGSYHNRPAARSRRPEDDLEFPKSAFSICSFWWSRLLALQGKLREAEALFNRLMSHANPLGLFSEHLDPETGAALGHFPQVCTHAGLIPSAKTIGRLREARDGRARGRE